MTARATVSPPTPESKIPMGAPLMTMRLIPQHPSHPSTPQDCVEPHLNYVGAVSSWSRGHRFTPTASRRSIKTLATTLMRNRFALKQTVCIPHYFHLQAPPGCGYPGHPPVTRFLTGWPKLSEHRLKPQPIPQPHTRAPRPRCLAPVKPSPIYVIDQPLRREYLLQ